MLLDREMLFGHIPVIGYKWRIHGSNACGRFTEADIAEAKELSRG